MPAGGRMPGAGRKPKAQEANIRGLAISAVEKRYGSLLDGFIALLGSEEPTLVKFVWEHAVGKPQDKVDVTSGGEKVATIQVEVISINRDEAKGSDE